METEMIKTKIERQKEWPKVKEKWISQVNDLVANSTHLTNDEYMDQLNALFKKTMLEAGYPEARIPIFKLGVPPDHK
jgi:hypothetical protein|tara:strand:- start:1019 stop:1249 length:231 start_codon:yes stop_codon:yes gene_type:complete